MIFTIHSKKHGYFGISIDDEFEFLLKDKWGVSFNKNGSFYVRRTVKGIYLAREIIQAHLGRTLGKHEHIDHISGDTTDNRIQNLRVVNHRQNMQNLPIHRSGRLVGAQFHKPTEKWRARIQINGKKFSLGCFETEQQAHEVYLSASARFPESKPSRA